MAQEWRWVSTAVAVAAHAEQLAEHGGGDGTRDTGALDSAMTRPQNLAEYGKPDVAALAAAYAYGIARNHPFVDGNKRTAFVTAVTFLRLNGLAFRPDPVEGVRMMERLASDEVTQGSFAGWLRDGAAAI
mgnify:CR=1 FL=1